VITSNMIVKELSDLVTKILEKCRGPSVFYV